MFTSGGPPSVFSPCEPGPKRRLLVERRSCLPRSYPVEWAAARLPYSPS